MKLQKKLSKKIIIFFLLLIFPFNSFAQTKDIWQKSKELKIEKKESTINNSDNKNQNSSDLPPTVFDKENTNLKIEMLCIAAALLPARFLICLALMNIHTSLQRFVPRLPQQYQHHRQDLPLLRRSLQKNCYFQLPTEHFAGCR